mgnify:FL=1|tara:strand:- start:45 stop:263 length:219 start_codon:yes stop_codon:yes gene_type:complete
MGLKKIYDEDGNHVGQIDDGKSFSSGGNSDPGCVSAILVICLAGFTWSEGHWSMWILIPLAAVLVIGSAIQR